MLKGCIGNSKYVSTRVSAPALAALIFLGGSTCWAQSRPDPAEEQLTGTWKLVSISATRPDGTKEQPFVRGEGSLMFDANGRYAALLCKLGRPKFASNNRLKGSADEYRATAEGCNNHWGKYRVDPMGHTFTLIIENATFPNLIGAEQTRPFTISGNELQYSTPGAAGGTAVAIWERAR